MSRSTFLIATFFLLSVIACGKKKDRFTKPFFDSKERHIGDTVYQDKAIHKIVFLDSSYYIDSIVYAYFENAPGILKSSYTFKHGKPIFQNIDYFENGRIRRYCFISEDNSEYLYERIYNDAGYLLKVNGDLFFQGIVNNMNNKDVTVKVKSPLSYDIFFPNPPDCKIKVGIRDENGIIHDVLKKDPYINFLKRGMNDNNSAGVFKIDFVLSLQEQQIDTSIVYTKELLFKVIPE